MAATLLVLLAISQTKGWWIEVGRSPSLGEMKAMVRAVGRDPVRDGDVVHALLLPPEEEEENPQYRLILGPFDTGAGAFRYGMTLLMSKRIRSFVLTDVHGNERLLAVPRAKRKSLLPFETRDPYPSMAVALAARVAAYSFPEERIPSMDQAVAFLNYRDEFWITEERLVCTKGRCRRWFRGITPPPYTMAWVPAGWVIPIARIRSVKNENGMLIAYTAVDWFAKDGKAYEWWAVSFAPGSRPLRWHLRTPRFFYLRMVRTEQGWQVVDARNVVHGELKVTDAAWRPVRSLFKSRSRREVFR